MPKDASTESDSDSNRTDVMSHALLDEIIKVRQEMRDSKWTSEKNLNLLILTAIFSSSGSQVKGIIEMLNLLALFERVLVAPS